MVSTMPWIVRSGLIDCRDLLDRLQQLAQAFEREELALQRHQHGIGRRHRIQRQQVERRRAVDQHIAVAGGAVWRPPARHCAGVSTRSGAEAISISTPSRSSVEGTMRQAGHRRRHRRLPRAPVRRSARRRTTRSGRGGRCPGRCWRCPAGRGRRSAHCSPMAASAVARLMAVVVLPTPPFWLATVMILGVMFMARLLFSVSSPRRDQTRRRLRISRMTPCASVRLGCSTRSNRH